MVEKFTVAMLSIDNALSCFHKGNSMHWNTSVHVFMLKKDNLYDIILWPKLNGGIDLIGRNKSELNWKSKIIIGSIKTSIQIYWCKQQMV